MLYLDYTALTEGNGLTTEENCHPLHKALTRVAGGISKNAKNSLTRSLRWGAAMNRREVRNGADPSVMERFVRDVHAAMTAIESPSTAEAENRPIRHHSNVEQGTGRPLKYLRYTYG
jgi:hypothetical protein